MSEPDKPKRAPFCMQPKEALRKIRESFDSASTVSTALNVYCALTEISSNMGGPASFNATHKFIGSLCGLTDRTVLKRVKDLTSIGVIEVKNQALKSPSLYTLSRYEINSERYELGSERTEAGSERSESARPSSFRSLEERKEKKKEARYEINSERKLSTPDRIGLEHQAELLRKKIGELEADGFYEWDRTPAWKTKLDALKAKLEDVEAQLLGGKI